MLVYGDAVRRVEPQVELEHLSALLERLRALPPGLGRHSALVGALILAGELAQGLADAAFKRNGRLDMEDPSSAASMALLLRLAGAVERSWNGGFTETGPEACAALTILAQAGLPDEIQVRRMEGFAYYALYPEAYLQAAAAMPRDASTQVIGIRSIGTVLGAMVAAALGTSRLWTLRPVGHPFHREVSVARDLADALVAEPVTNFAVVDEGPGLSGSSFGAVTSFLEVQGVSRDRITFFPGHAGKPGTYASPRSRAIWAEVTRRPASFDALLLDPARTAQRLEGWAADLLGPAVAPMQDISGGAWRALDQADTATWPAVHPWQERRKFLFRTADSTWLLKFAGLGQHGEERLAQARALHEAGFTPPVAGLLHGFLVERWIEDACPLTAGSPGKAALLDWLGRYLGFRARSMPARPEAGAPAAELLSMARHNTAQTLGEQFAKRLAVWEPLTDVLEVSCRRVYTDNRLHAWEWLLTPEGRLLKTDAVDHATAHDLIGCQDIAWDIVGAGCELGLSFHEQEELRQKVQQRAGCRVEPRLMEFLRPCYLAFQLGAWSLAAESNQDTVEGARLRERVDGYARQLSTLLMN